MVNINDISNGKSLKVTGQQAAVDIYAFKTKHQF